MSKLEHIEDLSDPNSNIITSIEKKSSGSTLEPSYSREKGVDEYLAKFMDISENAQANERKEKAMSLKEGLKTFPKAVMWSFILSSCLIMEGYDTNLLNSFYAFPGFKKKFGTYYPDLDDYQIPTRWQTSLSMAVNVGGILGLFASGIIADRIGYRKTIMGSLVLVIGLLFIVFFAESLPVLLVGELLLGAPWGAFQTLTVSYASEVCPLTLRVYLTTYVNACWVIGQLISSCVLRGVLDSTDDDAYRIPFGVQWVWPVPIMIGVFLAPESPWWLAKKGRADEAKRSLNRLLSKTADLPDTKPLANAMFDKIQLTIKEEETVTKGVSYFDCFKKGAIRRTRVASLTWLVQNITGSAFMGYSTYFYTQAGLDPGMSFTFSIIQYALGLIGTIGSWFLSQKLGRFTIYFTGLVTQGIILIVVGGLGCASNKSVSWGIGSLLLIFTFVYDLSVGPICYCLVSELPSVRLKTKTIIISRNVYNIAGIVISVISPYMLNPTAWNWGAKAGFFWAGFCVCSAAWAYFDLPETKGRTYAELDKLFADGVRARKFKSTEVETLNANEMIEKVGKDGIADMVIVNRGEHEDA